MSLPKKPNKDKSDPYPSGIEEDFYFENGLMVFTEKYHLKKGFCCGNKCRHCPYDWDQVPKDQKG